VPELRRFGDVFEQETTGDKKMAIRFNAWLLAPLCCLLASPAMAETGEIGQIDETNSYVSVNAGLNKTTQACNESPLLAGTVLGTCNAGGRRGTYLYRLAYGYQFTRAWGMEVSYGDLAYASGNGILATGPAPAVGITPYSWSLKTTGWAVGGTGTLHLGNVVSLFGKLGLVRAEFKEDINYFPINGRFQGAGPAPAITHPFAGAGVQIDFKPTFGIRVQIEHFGNYDVYGSNLPKIRLIQASGGLVFKF
jgi:hypothetical protein